MVCAVFVMILSVGAAFLALGLREKREAILQIAEQLLEQSREQE